MMDNGKDEKIKDLIFKIAEIGSNHKNDNPKIDEINIFKHYFNNDTLNIDELDKDDGGPWTRRELISRYLLLSAVLDQGPDISGVRMLLRDVINSLYKREIRILHQPLQFFKELNISIEELLEKHNAIKKIRATDWARENKTNPEKYRLFFAQQSRGIVPINQVLDYGIHRWGVPLALFYLLEKDSINNSKQPFIDYLENSDNIDSAEKMSRNLKDNERYGLGSAIGDKACHLFTKWYVNTFNLTKKKNDSGWSKWSFEVPFDSNAGRVLFRAGFFLFLDDLKKYEDKNIIQKGKGKNNKYYIRVTNFRGYKLDISMFSNDFKNKYTELVKKYLKLSNREPKYVQIQLIPNAILLNENYGIGDFDDGLIYIGTNFCFNHDKPKCEDCPLNDYCYGHKMNNNLITEYRT
ncbi:MAG: hypothetical protein ACP5JU_03895 [Minisyncoccia bacterium]